MSHIINFTFSIQWIDELKTKYSLHKLGTNDSVGA